MRAWSWVPKGSRVMLWAAATRPHFHEQCGLRRPFLLMANTQVSGLVRVMRQLFPLLGFHRYVEAMQCPLGSD